MLKARLWFGASGMAVGLTFAAAPALTIPLPDAPASSAPHAKKPHKPAAKPGGGAAAPAVSPLLTRIRGAPPSHDTADQLASGQTWAVQVSGPSGLTCKGALKLKGGDASDGFGGLASLSCAEATSNYSFTRSAKVVEIGGEVLVTFTGRSKEPRAPNWKSFSLQKDGPDKMTGVVTDGAQSSAITLLLSEK